MRAWPVLLLLLTALSGCTGDDGDPTLGSGHEMGGPGGTGGFDVAPAELPSWRVGDYWTYQDNLGQKYSLVVAADAGSDWDVLSNDKQIARFDSWFDISFVGKVRKTDLAGQQGTQRIQFFDFPLHDGKSWMTVWDGIERHVTVQGLQDGTFYVVAHVAGNEVGDKHADYVYDPAIGHFSSMSFYDANGTVAYAATLDGSGHDFTGTLYRYGPVQELANITVNGPVSYVSQQFQVEDTPGELTLNGNVTCGATPSAPLYGVLPPNEDGTAAATPPTPFINSVEPIIGNDQPCPDAEGGQSAILEDPPAGAWRFDGSAPGGDPGAIQFTAFWQTREDLVR